MFKVRQAFSKLSKMSKKWLINVSEELDTIIATLSNGRSLKQIFFRSQLIPCVSSYYEKLKIC